MQEDIHAKEGPGNILTLRRIYVAGSYNADNVIGVLDNIRIGLRACTELLMNGYAPWSPWLDFQLHLQLHGKERITVNEYRQYAIAWLAVSEAVIVLPNSEKSEGTQAEIKIAKELGIPIFNDPAQLDEWATKTDKTMEGL